MSFFDLKQSPSSCNISTSLSSSKALLFSSLKKNISQQLIDRTTSATRQQDDEYEDPIDLPKITIGTNMNGFGCVLKGEFDSNKFLTKTNFGQVFNQLKG